MNNIQFYQFDKITRFIDYRGRTPKKTESGITLITAKNIKFGYLSEQPKEFIAESNYDEWMTRGIPNKGDILFTTEAPLGNVCILNTNEKRAFAQRAIILQPISHDIYCSPYLFYYLMSPMFMDELDSRKTGTTVKGIKTSILKKFKIPLPTLQEQKRIVAKLDSLFAKIDQAITLHQQNIDEAEALMGAVLNDVFGELEERYGATMLSSVVKINSGISLPKIFKDIEQTNGEFEFFKVAQMNNDKRIMKDANLKFTLQEATEHKIKLFPKGSILIPKRGGAILTNKKRILLNDASYDSNIMGLKANNDLLSDEFLFAYLNSIDLANFVDTATIPQINNKHIEMMSLPIPSLKTQQKTVHYLDQLSQKTKALKKAQQEKMQSLKDLKASLLDRAFRGEL